MHNSANVTIENLGVNDVEGLTLTIEHSSLSVGETYSLDVLQVGEKREMRGSVFSVVGTTGWVTVTLKLGDVIVDEYIIPRFPNTNEQYPESQSWIILPLFTIATLLIITCKKRLSKKQVAPTIILGD